MGPESRGGRGKGSAGSESPWRWWWPRSVVAGAGEPHVQQPLLFCQVLFALGVGRGHGPVGHGHQEHGAPLEALGLVERRQGDGFGAWPWSRRAMALTSASSEPAPRPDGAGQGFEQFEEGGLGLPACPGSPLPSGWAVTVKAGPGQEGAEQLQAVLLKARARCLAERDQHRLDLVALEAGAPLGGHGGGAGSASLFPYLNRGRPPSRGGQGSCCQAPSLRTSIGSRPKDRSLAPTSWLGQPSHDTQL